MSSIQFYNDDACLDPVGLGNTTGTPDGLCTQFTEAGWGSFRVVTLERTCAITIYGSDVSFCSSANIGIANFGACMTNTTVNQFSVDCQDYSIATSDSPASYVSSATRTPTASATSTSTATAEASSSDGGLTGAKKAGIAVGTIASVLIIVGLVVYFIMRNRRKKAAGGEGTQDGEFKAIGWRAASAPPQYELPPQEKKMAELPQRHSMLPVEAPGDNHWAGAQELDGGSAVDGPLMSSDDRTKGTVSSPTLVSGTDDGKRP